MQEYIIVTYLLRKGRNIIQQNHQSYMGKNNQQLDIYSLKYIAASFVATYFAGVVHPLELIKTRFQSHDGRASHENIVPKYSSLNNAFKTIYQNEGIRGLYKGFYISLLSQASAMSLFFWGYEIRKTHYEKIGEETMTAVTKASVEASVLTAVVTQPLWMIRTRMLLNVNPKISQFQNFKSSISEIIRQNGFKGFLKGLQLSLLLSVSGVIQMYVYESCKIIYEVLQIPQTRLDEKNFFCGSISKLSSVLLSYPLTTLRTRIQQNQFVNGSKCEKYGGILNLTKRTWAEEGILGFYKGMSANLMRGVAQKGIYFYFYEVFKKILIPKNKLTKIGQ